MQMLDEGRSLPEIQEFIDEKYAAHQKERTPTPLPPLEGSAGEPEES